MASSSSQREWVSPKPFYMVKIEHRISAENGHIQQFRLRYQHSVKWVTMMRREQTGPDRHCHGDSRFGECFLLRENTQILEQGGGPHLAGADFDGKFPGYCCRNQNLIRRTLDDFVRTFG